jgi:6,7-dimethyl-8-ribityllumazine synthase
MSLSSENNNLLNINNLQISDNLQVVIVYTEWNEHIIQELINGANRVFAKFPTVKVKLYQVPGCVEIPFAINQHHQHLRADAYIAFGCVIRGETPHFDYVCDAVTHGISTLNTSINSPTIFGILTVNKIEEAMDRIGGKHGHKGEEAAVAALKMASLKNAFITKSENDFQEMLKDLNS